MDAKLNVAKKYQACFIVNNSIHHNHGGFMSLPQANYSNRLAQETSPYLLQHADNPVDWHPWGPEALARAREEDKPILLSIGYSACHWCHVMAHESFEDVETAEVMNRLFINIKVDREERPDLDKIYQGAHHLLNQRAGGWPLTVVLVPDDHTPFFAGTYFPSQPHHGLPSFKDLLTQVENFYRTNRNDIQQQNTSLVAALEQMNPVTDGPMPDINSLPLDQARRELEQSFDNNHGGFGGAPKFPHPTNLERLLRHWAATRQNNNNDKRAQDMVHFSLHAMASGGIYDQLGGGFYRYSVDEHWMIPHFEKMLYDNGPLLALYADAWAAFDDPVYKRITEETGEWVIREMQSPQGGYYSTLDADSEGEEGKFYVWTPEQIKEILTEDEYAVLSRVYGLDQPANFEGQWHLHVYDNTNNIAKKLKLLQQEVSDILNQSKKKLFKVRQQRNHPGRDEKILTAWNGLMIKGLATAGRRLQRNDFIVSAQQALDFIKSNLYQDNRLLASYKDGRARHMAYLDDYVFLIDGILELLQADWRDEDLSFAINLAETVLEHFEDKEQGGFYFTANDHEQLIHRPKPTQDEAIPAGNGIAAYVLARLGHLLGETHYLNASERTLQFAWTSLTQFPHAHGALLHAVEEHLYPPQVIILRGTKEEMQPWLQRSNQQYAPRRMCFAILTTSQKLPGLLAERKPQDNLVAYVCDGTTCQTPITDEHELAKLFDKN